jgi:hypothetical protein
MPSDYDPLAKVSPVDQLLIDLQHLAEGGQGCPPDFIRDTANKALDAIFAALRTPTLPDDRDAVIAEAANKLLDIRAINAGDFKRSGAAWEAYDRAVLDCYEAIRRLSDPPVLDEVVGTGEEQGNEWDDLR